MYEITLRGGPRARGRSQGEAFAAEIRGLMAECQSAWLAGMPTGRVALLRDNMVTYMRNHWPALIDELAGIAEGADLPFDDICTLNFVSAIGALGPGCSNFIVRQTASGPVLGKTSDIGEDYRYYSLQRVMPDEGGLSYLAISWIGCLWAEVGINSAGLSLGQGSGPTQPAQRGYGVPTLQYPRALLAGCKDTAEALALSAHLDMAGKGLNMAMVDAAGDAAVVERSGTRYCARRPAADAIYCTNHFVSAEMQGMIPLSGPGLPAEEITADSQERLADLERFFAAHAEAYCKEDLLGLLRRQRHEGGLAQNVPPGRVTHFAYLLLPQRGEMWISQGRPWETEFACHKI